MSKPKYTFVLPVYNEQARIGTSLTRILEFVEKSAWSSEILVVDDGSMDATVEIVSSIAVRDCRVQLLRNDKNYGKGYSVRRGVLSAEGEIIIFTDADLSAPIEEARSLVNALASGSDIAIGSRWANSELQTLRQPLYRGLFGRCFNLVTRVFLGLPFADTQCGIKAFSRPASRVIFSLQQIERWAFDAEILFIGLRHGCRVSEVPVAWGHDNRSTIKYFRAGSEMLKDIALIRLNSLRGFYGFSGVISQSTVTKAGTIQPPDVGHL